MKTAVKCGRAYVIHYQGNLKPEAINNIRRHWKAETGTRYVVLTSGLSLAVCEVISRGNKAESRQVNAKRERMFNEVLRHFDCSYQSAGPT